MSHINDVAGVRTPPQYDRILIRSQQIGFSMNSDALTGAFLRTLAASKPSGAFLELGTGCGLGTCWMLEGMDATSSLVSVDNDARAQGIANSELGHDPRLRLVLTDGGSFLENCNGHFDLIYADAWPGKYSHLQTALDLVKPGGIYLVDDMLPQPNWPEDHAPKVAALRDTLERLPGFITTQLSWSTGLMVCVKTPVANRKHATNR